MTRPNVSLESGSMSAASWNLVVLYVTWSKKMADGISRGFETETNRQYPYHAFLEKIKRIAVYFLITATRHCHFNRPNLKKGPLVVL